MRKLFLLFFLVFGFNLFGQTYDIIIGYERQTDDDKKEEFQNSYPTFSQEVLGWGLNGNSSRHIKMKSSENSGDSHIDNALGYYFRNTNGPQVAYINFKNVLVESFFTDYYIDVALNYAYGQTLYSVDQGDNNIEFDDLITPGKSHQLIHTYMGNLFVQDFKPNVSLFLPPNRDPANGTKTICANEQFGVFAYPQGFPSQIYNWQYSLDNKGTWSDVPDEFHVYNPTFTIFDLLGSNHLNYIGKTIYFRMGYNSMVFAGGIEFPLIYSACTPLVNKVEYRLPPLCYGDNIRDITVTFDRNLNTGEELRYFQLKAVNPGTNAPDGTPPIIYPFFSEGDENNGLVTQLDEKSSGVYTYSLLNFKGLNPNSTYQIQYQAFQNDINKGVSISPKTQNIKYTEPEPISFNITNAVNPVCFGDTAEITIDVSGGTGDYKFYVDGIEQKNPEPIIETDGYYHIRGLITTATNSIKVTDTNDCIEKATN